MGFLKNTLTNGFVGLVSISSIIAKTFALIPGIVTISPFLIPVSLGRFAVKFPPPAPSTFTDILLSPIKTAVISPCEENNLTNENTIEVGQVLQIPKLGEEPAIGGGNTTIWGSKIEGDSYTVAEGDWLSTIAARAYGDIMAYVKLAEANNISNPDLIEPGQVLKIPR